MFADFADFAGLVFYYSYTAYSYIFNFLLYLTCKEAVVLKSALNFRGPKFLIILPVLIYIDLLVLFDKSVINTL
jgi:hypothetical protein